MTIHKEAFTARPADGYIHPDHETRHQVLRRHWWAIVSLLTVRARLAERCPDVAAGRAQERLVIREGEFTVDHRPVSLRILLAECHCCPDPEPLEPIMHPNRDTAEAIYAASTTALARLRWFAENDTGLLEVFRDYDAALAPVLGVDPADVPAATDTRPQISEADKEFEELIKSSSLGQHPVSPEAMAAMQRGMGLGAVVLATEALSANNDEQLRQVMTSIPPAAYKLIPVLLAQIATAHRAAQPHREEYPA